MPNYSQSPPSGCYFSTAYSKLGRQLCGGDVIIRLNDLGCSHLRSRRRRRAEVKTDEAVALSDMARFQIGQPLAALHSYSLIAAMVWAMSFSSFSRAASTS
jgi:hypothetical protein